MDFIVILQHSLCQFNFAREGSLTKIAFLDDFAVQSKMRSQEEEGLSDEEWDALEQKRAEEDEAEDEEEDEDSWEARLGLEKGGRKIIMTDEYVKAFGACFEDFINSEDRILICDFSFPIADRISASVEQVQKDYPGLYFYCVVFSHDDEDTIYMNSSRPPENSLGWRNWYKEHIGRLYSVYHFVDIPYGFVLNDEYLWGLVDKENPHLPDSRDRRKWLGNAVRRCERGFARGAQEIREEIKKENRKPPSEKEET
ncbi:MAG: hypothetical protein LBS82_00885 [Spirochaetaceae bacterium]|jgi:hypothetical protein|nr:hypothetical protein [Spirochaetaceae bacterium]